MFDIPLSLLFPSPGNLGTDFTVYRIPCLLVGDAWLLLSLSVVLQNINWKFLKCSFQHSGFELEY